MTSTRGDRGVVGGATTYSGQAKKETSGGDTSGRRLLLLQTPRGDTTTSWSSWPPHLPSWKCLLLGLLVGSLAGGFTATTVLANSSRWPDSTTASTGSTPARSRSMCSADGGETSSCPAEWLRDFARRRSSSDSLPDLGLLGSTNTVEGDTGGSPFQSPPSPVSPNREGATTGALSAILVPPGDSLLHSIGFSSLFAPMLKQPRIVLEHYLSESAASGDEDETDGDSSSSNSEDDGDTRGSSGYSSGSDTNSPSKSSRSKKSGPVDRSNFTFKQEDRIPKSWSPTSQDYLRSGYSRGHLAPAASHKGSEDEMRATFSIGVNISPQNQNFNAGQWLRLEALSRELRKWYNDVLVFSGPMWLPNDMSSELPTVTVNFKSKSGGSGGSKNKNRKSGDRSASAVSSATFVCMRHWAGSTESLPIRLEALEGVSTMASSPSEEVPPRRRKASQKSKSSSRHSDGNDADDEDSDDSGSESDSDSETAGLPAVYEAKGGWETVLAESYRACGKHLREVGTSEAPVLQGTVDFIGHHLIPVPTHFFKVIAAVGPVGGGRPQVSPPLKASFGSGGSSDSSSSLPEVLIGTFLLPNKPLVTSINLEAYRVPLGFVEFASGLDLSVVSDIAVAAKNGVVSSGGGISGGGSAAGTTGGDDRSDDSDSSQRSSTKGRSKGKRSSSSSSKKGTPSVEEALIEYDLCAYGPPKEADSEGDSSAGGPSFCQITKMGTFGSRRKSQY